MKTKIEERRKYRKLEVKLLCFLIKKALRINKMCERKKWRCRLNELDEGISEANPRVCVAT